MIRILSHNPKIFSVSKIKYFIKKIIGWSRGPETILSSLAIGLEKNGYNFEVNKISANTKKIHIISGIDTLKYAIKEKESGRNFELIAGPNLVVSPLDFDKIITNKNIDKILLPSEWTADVYSTITPEIKNKIYIWPAGTDCNVAFYKNKKSKCIVFKKNTEQELFEDIRKYLENEKIDYDIIEYGKYSQKEYFKLLEGSKFLIYLQTSESQGMALQEAWARNVPTFVWNKGYVICNDIKFYGKISAPYLTEKTGAFFKDFTEFKDKLPRFIDSLENFRPAEYCKENLSIERSAKIYTDIIENKTKPWINK